MAAEDYYDDYPCPYYDRDIDDEPYDEYIKETYENKRSMYGHRRNTVPMWNGRPIKGMDTDHIMNCILYCERKFVMARDNFYKAHPVTLENSDKAQKFYFDSVSKMFPDYDNLHKEYEKRKKED